MNGNAPTNIPADVVWDENNPPVIYACSQYTEHDPACEGDCESQVATENLVKLMNEGFAYRRAGMSYYGIVASYSMIPVSGIPVEVFDVMMLVEVLRDHIVETTDITEDELHEKFRIHKYEFLHNVREASEARVRKQRAANALGIVEGPGLLGPDGNPIG